MSVKIAINGFGRIGRLAFRRISEDNDLEVVAINDLSSPANLAYLLKYDSAQKEFKGHDVSYNDEGIIFDGKLIPVFAIKEPSEIPWGNHGVDLVLECTGRFKDFDKANAHIHDGVKGVIISAPAGNGIPTFVYGVNSDKLDESMSIVSGASCTTNCLAPIMKVLDDNFGVEGGFMTTVHAYTNDQTTLDLVKEKDFRRGRASATNIVPTTTGAAKALHLVLPNLKGKLQGGALRVPVLDGSLVDLTLTLNKKVSKDEIDGVMKLASEKELKNVLGYNEDLIVSGDIIGLESGSLYDASQTVVFETDLGKQFVKVVAWYDNEYSYTCQYVRLAKKMAQVKGLL